MTPRIDPTTPAITPEKIEEWRALLAKATSGPWKQHLVDDTTIVASDFEIGTTWPGGGLCADRDFVASTEIHEANAALIVAAVNALPALLDLASSALSAQAYTGWRSMESAPKDGTHILACRVPIGIRTTFNTHPPTVVHWFDDGFYTSVNEMAPERPFEATAWMPLPPPPVEGGAKAKTDGHAVHAAPAAVKRNDWMAEARRDMIIQALGGNVDALTVAFTWRYTPEGGAYWLKQCDFGLTDEGRARLHEMLAELDASTPPAKGGE